jgi:hypothetical protein
MHKRLVENAPQNAQAGVAAWWLGMTRAWTLGRANAHVTVTDRTVLSGHNACTVTAMSRDLSRCLQSGKIMDTPLIAKGQARL